MTRRPFTPTAVQTASLLLVAACVFSILISILISVIIPSKSFSTRAELLTQDQRDPALGRIDDTSY